MLSVRMKQGKAKQTQRERRTHFVIMLQGFRVHRTKYRGANSFVLFCGDRGSPIIEIHS